MFAVAVIDNVVVASTADSNGVSVAIVVNLDVDWV